MSLAHKAAAYLVVNDCQQLQPTHIGPECLNIRNLTNPFLLGLTARQYHGKRLWRSCAKNYDDKVRKDVRAAKRVH